MFRDTFDVIVNHIAVCGETGENHLDPAQNFWYLSFSVRSVGRKKKYVAKKSPSSFLVMSGALFFLSFLLISKTKSRSQSVYCDYRETQGYNILYSHTKYVSLVNHTRGV